MLRLTRRARYLPTCDACTAAVRQRCLYCSLLILAHIASLCTGFGNSEGIIYRADGTSRKQTFRVAAPQIANKEPSETH